MANSTLIKKLSMTVAGAALITLGAVSTAQAGTVVAPNSQETTEGNFDNGFPFNIGFFSLSSQRYQQVYAASEFASFSEPQNITQILFRPDAFFGSAFSSTLPNIQINLSTTSKAPDRLSTAFADNIGNDDTVVFSGPLSLSSAFTGPAGGPKDFDIVINLMTPFLYNPGAGNLLLDVRNFAGGVTTFFDAQLQTGDSTSRGYTLGANDVNASTGSGDSLGLVTKFVTTPPSKAVPEPTSVMGLLAVAALGSGSVLKRKQNQKASDNSLN
jgi:hypothetical protein